MATDLLVLLVLPKCGSIHNLALVQTTDLLAQGQGQLLEGSVEEDGNLDNPPQHDTSILIHSYLCLVHPMVEDVVTGSWEVPIKLTQSSLGLSGHTFAVWNNVGLLSCDRFVKNACLLLYNV